MKLVLHPPVSPIHVNQLFGNDTAYYARFHDAFGNPEKGHNGLDLMAYHGQPVYASIDGTAVYTRDDHGGEGCIITTDQPYEYPGGTCWFNVIHWHLVGDTDPAFPPPIPMHGVKTRVKVGDLIGYADNTGAPYESSGDHLHLGLVPVDANQKVLLPANGFNGCIDPGPFLTTVPSPSTGIPTIPTHPSPTIAELTAERDTLVVRYLSLAAQLLQKWASNLKQ